MNPLGTLFAENLAATLHHNTTLIRLGLLTRTLPAKVMNEIGHVVQLNEAGRGFLRREASAPLSLLFPCLLDRVSNEPDLIYGLLKERPDLWIQRQLSFTRNHYSTKQHKSPWLHLQLGPTRPWRERRERKQHFVPSLIVVY
jgi:hypothetical protein